MRPLFHFTAERGWINDPHGITAHSGRYHLFYQYVPDALEWAPECAWGHATGTDLVSWTRHPVALSPGDGDDGVWTGSLAVDDLGTARIFYTSVALPDVGIGTVREARPRERDWREWEKLPIVAAAPAELAVTAFRDPFVFRSADPDGTDCWRMLVGAALADGSAAALSYRRPGAEVAGHGAEWEFEGIAASRSAAETDPVWTGALWECPQLFEVDGRHVLVVSVWQGDVLHHVAYGVGGYEDGMFSAAVWGRLTYGPSYYAPSFLRDDAGRPTLVFWLRQVEDRAAGWVGAHSVPHLLSLDGDVLVATPHDDLARYRRPSIAATSTAFDALWSPETSDRCVVNSGTTELYAIERHGAELILHRGADTWTMPYGGGPVRMIVDGQVVEVSCSTGMLAASIAGGSALSLAASGRVQSWGLER